jgi:hypothetical protein
MGVIETFSSKSKHTEALQFVSNCWLLDFMSDRSRHRVPGQQPRLALAALREDRPRQPRIKCRYLVQQDKHKTAGQAANNPANISANAETGRIGK